MNIEGRPEVKGTLQIKMKYVEGTVKKEEGKVGE